MDSPDCLFRSAYGSGKTGILALIALCIVKISKEFTSSHKSSFENPYVITLSSLLFVQLMLLRWTWCVLNQCFGQMVYSGTNSNEGSCRRLKDIIMMVSSIRL
ncbi:hypothetical protein F5879DRAFT_941984 [Lentinula edodes]|uniref:uncharacterized protein n=1 Tax=Lentinula edodes TaxID=5353 RepID=UPI001E8EB014|nr:uncharacterized protein C8R40DRAFT_1120111 [Lentinula edodes]KAH7871752.1 hypothetical protein C8R40DRAFT_1120111 [Lentinula edodes]KAJ3907427.1 hypothetical protein F5879DRAFT_941984 [Lentinula edodes]